MGKAKRSDLSEREQLDAILSSMSEGLIMVGKNAQVVLMNQAAAALLRVAPVEAVGKSVYSVLALLRRGKPIARQSSPIAKALQEETVHAIRIDDDTFCKNASGELFPVAMSIAGLSGYEDIGGVITFSDVTREKEISRMESEFISTASHQLRTPMTGIQWVVERFLKKEQVTSRGRGYLQDIHASIKRLTALVDLLLNVSRIEGGRVGISPKQLDLVDFIHGYLQECGPLVAEKNLKLVFAEHPEKLHIVSDASALRNVVQSLVSNAIEYTPKNGTIEIAVGQGSAPGAFMLSIRDTGIGIPKEDQGTIFEKFTRAENARLVKTDGTGLGLYIAKQAVELLGGSIWLKSEEGKGTAFFVELPMQSREREGEKTLASA